MPPKQKSYDYEAFAPQLKRHRCIWDIKHDNYSLSDYRSVAFERIERNMGIEREFRFSIAQCLHIDSRSRQKCNVSIWSWWTYNLHVKCISVCDRHGKLLVSCTHCLLATVHWNIEATTFFYRPFRKEREGYVFTRVCYCTRYYCSYSSLYCFHDVLFVLIL